MVREPLPVHPDRVPLSAREQRVTGTIVFILTGISVFLAPVLKVRLCALHQGLSACESTGRMRQGSGEGLHVDPQGAGPEERFHHHPCFLEYCIV